MLCDNLEGWNGVKGGRGRFKGEGPYIHPWLIHVDVWQKPTQRCKAVILRLNINLKNKLRKFKKKETTPVHTAKYIA